MTLSIAVIACLFFTAFVFFAVLFIYSVYKLGRDNSINVTGPVIYAALAGVFLFFWLLCFYNVYWTFM